MPTNKITFYEGEKREVTATVTSKDPKETVVITSAKYELQKTYDDSIIQEGSCEIDGNEATALLDLSKKGEYKLTITSQVGREVLVKKTLVVIK